MIFDGVIDGLKAMRDQGLKTGGRHQQAHGIHDTAAAAHGPGRASSRPWLRGDTCARKARPAARSCMPARCWAWQPDRAVTIGDSINDAQAGRDAGTRVLVVPYGYNEGVDVRTLDVDGTSCVAG